MEELQRLLQAQCACLPPVGSDLLEMATFADMDINVIIEQMLLRHGDLPLIPLTVSAGNKANYKWVGGHALSPKTDGDYGPVRRYKAMFVFKCLSRYDVNSMRQMSSPSSVAYKQMLRDAGLTSGDDIYVTSLLKTTMLKSKATLPKAWIKQQDIFLMLEILLTRPEIIVGFGREVCDWFVPKFKMTVGEGRWQRLSLDTTLKNQLCTPTGIEPGVITPSTFEFDFLPAASPAIIDVEEVPEARRRLLVSANAVVDRLLDRKGAVSIGGGTPVEYPVVNSIVELKRYFDIIATSANRRLVAVDAEWQGQHPQNTGSYIRCIQFAWDRGKAIVVKLHDTQGRPTFVDEHGQTGQIAFLKMFDLIERYWAHYKLRLVGFYFQADNEWLSYFGLNLLQFYEAADTPERCRDEGAVAVELAVLAYDELMTNDLETVRKYFTRVWDYYSGFEAKKVELKPTVSAKVAEDGYGWIPDEVLFPYAGGDVDVTITAALTFLETLLDGDAFGNNLWLPYWNTLRAASVACEIMRIGMPFNMKTAMRYAMTYRDVVNSKLNELSEAFNWPNFPIDTWQQLNVALYGPSYSGYVNSSGKRIDKRPDGAKTLNLQPVLSNSTPPQTWDKVIALGQEATSNPTSGLKALGILRYADTVKARVYDAADNVSVVDVPPPPEVKLIADTKILRQVQKNFVGDISTKVRAKNTEPVWQWTGGYPEHVCDDDYLRCFISMTKETARWSAARPNLHNSPNTAEGHYYKIMQDKYPGPIRSMFESPDGFVIVETDLASAELFMLAMAGQDDVLWDHCTRNLLPEDDPKFIDPHSSICVKTFGLQCQPTKSGLESVGMTHLRGTAKCFAEGEYIWTDRGLVLVQQFFDENDVAIDLSPNAKSISGYTPLLAGEYAGVVDCVEITTSVGSRLVVTRAHKSFVIDVHGNIGVKEAADTLVGDQMLIQTEEIDPDDDYRLPAVVISQLSVLLARHILFKKGSWVLQPQVCYILAVLRTHAKVLHSNELYVNVNSASLKEAVELYTLLHAVISPKWTVRMDGASSGIIINGLGIAEAYTGFCEMWEAIPDLVKLWSVERKVAYLRGIISGKVFGCRQGVGCLVPIDLAHAVQMLVSSCGYMWQFERKSNTAEQLMYPVREVDREFMQVCSKMQTSEPTELPSTTAAWQKTSFDRIHHKLVKVMGPAIGFSPSREPNCSRVQLLVFLTELIEFVSRFRCTVSNDDLDYLELCQLILSGRLHPVWVSSVKPVGKRKVYDFQTDDTQKNALVAGAGILTHNSALYGWAYGRMADAIVVGAQQMGITVTKKQVQDLLDFLPKQFAGAGRYLEESAARVDKGFLVTPMGRIRRAPISTDRKVVSGYRREFKNAPVQSGVADIVNRIAFNLKRLREAAGMRFMICLQMHDAFYFLVPYNEIMQLCTEIIPKAFVELTPIVTYSLDGRLSGGEPKYMGYNIAIMRRWKEKMKAAKRCDWLRSIGVEPNDIPRLEIE